MRENSLPAVEIVALAMLFAGALAYFQLSGLGYTFDSSRYLYFASQMALNGNYSTNIVYAPLYPIVLSLLLRVGLPFDLATALIAAGSVTAIWYFALRALSFLTADRLAAALGATFIDLFAFQQPIFEYIWTEQLYAALLSAAAFLAVSYCAGSSRRLPLAALLVTSILPGARYIGAFPMAAFGAVLLLTFWRRNGFQLRALPLAAAGGLAIGSTFLVIAAYHLSQGSCVLGCRRPSTTTSRTMWSSRCPCLPTTSVPTP